MNYPYLKNKNVLLGVSSGIALYKAVDLASKLRKLDVGLNIILTPNAEKLIDKTVFSAVGDCNVYTSIKNDVNGGWIPHTSLSADADVFVVAPATTNTIAKLNAGFADNLLTATASAFDKEEKIIVATMNTRMFENKANLRNLKGLEEMGWKIMFPDEGHLACGEVGKGRYPDNENILEFIDGVLAPKDYEGKKVVITAGPTIEPIDPVRSITNRSSGKMGYELARELAARGAEVYLISGPTKLKPPFLVKKFFSVESVDEMFKLTLKFFKEADIAIMAAAVSDYKVKNYSNKKIKKSSENLIIELEKNPDILKELGKIKNNTQITVGFAAETNDVIEYANKKLINKNADIIVSNDVSRKDIGFDSNQNEVVLISKDGEKHVEKSSKRDISVAICNYISSKFSK
ncbi:DNA/pantothenate metabolism flavoprotein [Tepiditoga spiralis]|uniref:Coenzyme A biosynthesis bifunctional protein CoaBC n=1 Tax=Tepiditoga spiralis TaxID=2108365 RepID=A0A7G1G9W4_9BACT|nr:bifunctional phosphopantothenoylcysteine decarboxylase/phosphopantothenate--cysteine ligase CoaBC [Tepiditoga spiralis]BBE30129.1 DNA/pantothenate metabolism flavoprotein [Tepiditoga spiralis]